MSASPPSLYVPLDANYLRDPKIRRAGPDAELLYLRGLAHSKSGETDGVIHDYDLDVIAVGLDGAEDRAAKLVEVGAWSEPVRSACAATAAMSSLATPERRASLAT